MLYLYYTGKRRSKQEKNKCKNIDISTFSGRFAQSYPQDIGGKYKQISAFAQPVDNFLHSAVDKKFFYCGKTRPCPYTTEGLFFGKSAKNRKLWGAARQNTPNVVEKRCFLRYTILV